MEPKPYHHGDLAPAIVTAGLEILEADGLAALSMRAIAARVGVSHTAPKNHFPSFRALTTAIATEGFRRHTAALEAAISSVPKPRKRLRIAAKVHARLAEEAPALFELMYAPRYADPTDPSLAEAVKALGRVLDTLGRGLDWAPLMGRAPGRKQTRQMLWSFLHGHAALSLAGHGEGEVTAVLPGFSFTSGKKA